ncbi:MAG: hypothetical protein QY326_09260 [Bdellovibrionota bacterium]|nr:MAG: hypothetical protein QY326_09260 [Bdellovibrionota bacterium]
MGSDLKGKPLGFLSVATNCEFYDDLSTRMPIDRSAAFGSQREIISAAL